MTAAVRTEGLVKAYPGGRGVNGLDLEVPAGTVLGLLGPNGAGKSTTVRVLTTLLRPDGGRAEVAGHDVVGDPAGVRRAIGSAGQQAAVDGRLTGRENLVLLGRLHGLGRATARRRADDLLQRFDLVPNATRLARTYSGGTRRRLDLAASLVNAPRVLFLDEPTTGLDPVSRLALWEVVRELVAEGTTVLLTTQYLEEAEQLADRLVVLIGGREVAAGTVGDLKRGLGRETLTIRFAGRLPSGTAAAAGVPGDAEIHLDEAGARMTVRLADATAAVAPVVRGLDAAGVAITGLEVGRPTLDDVFVALATGSGPTR